MWMEHWWIYADRGAAKYSEKNLPERHFVNLNPTETDLVLNPILRDERPAKQLRPVGISHLRILLA
jgi:hypothetical protein